MILKTSAALAAAVAVSGLALLSPAPAQASPGLSIHNQGYVIQVRHGGPHRVSRVQASGVASSGKLVPYFVKKARAQRNAVANWNARVLRLYGARYANWNRASAKATACTRLSATTVRCRVSAMPTSYRVGMR